MMLNWYVNREKCTIKINIDKDGVYLIERNGVTDAQLQANKDVKIGGLFLHQIQFREKGKGQENEMQKDSQSFETTTRVSKDTNQKDKRDVGVQATYMNRGISSRTTISWSDSESDLSYESQEKSSQNKRTPTPPPPRSSSLPPKGNVFSEQTSAKFVSQDDGQRDKQNNSTSGNHQNDKYQPTTVSHLDSKDNYGFPSSDPLDSSTFTKSVSHNQDNRQNDERYDNPTFTTFGHTLPGSQKPDGNEQENSMSGNQQQPEIQQQSN